MAIYSDWLTSAAWEVFTKGLAYPFFKFAHFVRSKSPYKTVEICLRHRCHTTERYYERAFVSGADVLYVTIMSQASIKLMPKYLEQCKRTPGTRLRVLTWHGDTPSQVVEAYRRHLGEASHDPKRALQQVRQARDDWRALEKEYKNILTVREYRSNPTMQGLIVSDRWAMVELLPYTTPPGERPALILNRKAEPELFSLFKNQWEKLWDDSADLP